MPKFDSTNEQLFSFLMYFHVAKQQSVMGLDFMFKQWESHWDFIKFTTARISLIFENHEEVIKHAAYLFLFSIIQKISIWWMNIRSQNDYTVWFSVLQIDFQRFYHDDFHFLEENVKWICVRWVGATHRISSWPQVNEPIWQYGTPYAWPSSAIQCDSNPRSKS